MHRSVGIIWDKLVPIYMTGNFRDPRNCPQRCQCDQVDFSKTQTGRTMDMALGRFLHAELNDINLTWMLALRSGTVEHPPLIARLCSNFVVNMRPPLHKALWHPSWDHYYEPPRVSVMLDYSLFIASLDIACWWMVCLQKWMWLFDMPRVWVCGHEQLGVNISHVYMCLICSPVYVS